MFPTTKPSTKPSLSPSLFPSQIPTDSPSIIPSSFPTLDPCIGRNGTYGSLSETEKLYVYYKYGIETDKEIKNVMSATMSDIIYDLENMLLNNLIDAYFPSCHSDDRRRAAINQYNNDIEGRKNTVKRNLSQLIGLSSKPTDIANGGKYKRT